MPKIRLQNTVAGYIEVNDGSIWRKVRVQKWDSKRQNSLCEHLGFSLDGNSGHTRSNVGDKLARGTLICYNAQPSGTSCCADLQTSTAGSRVFIQHVNCKFKRGSRVQCDLRKMSLGLMFKKDYNRLEG